MSAMFRIPIRPDFELQLCVHAHAEPAFELIDRNREYLRQWLPWVDHCWSIEDVVQWIIRGLDQLQRNEGWHAALWYQDQLAGFIGFKPVNWLDLRVEIGYWLAEEFQGRGLMTDAVRAATTYAFSTWHMNRVEIRCAAGNRASAAIPRRLGFVQEGMLRQAFRVRDEFQDLLLFAMLRSDWRC